MSIRILGRTPARRAASWIMEILSPLARRPAWDKLMRIPVMPAPNICVSVSTLAQEGPSVP